MSDHFSGPRALAGPAADITDFYVFPSPERPGHLVLVTNIAPLSRPDASFSDAIDCRFRLRPVTIAGTGTATAFPFAGEDQELMFICHFEEPQQGGNGTAPAQDGWLLTPSGEQIRFRVNDEGGARGDGVRVYAGVRSDPFFIDLAAFFETLQTGRLSFKEVGTNSVERANVLSVVVEVDARPWLKAGRGPLFGAVAETVVAGKLPIRIERFGRMEVKNVTMAMKQVDPVNRDLEIRDLYNLEDAFHLSKDYGGAYRSRLNANLAFFDRLDGKVDWPLGPDGAHPLTELFVADYMVVDVSRPFAADSYLEIEQATLAGRPHETCGGRSLNHDVMDTHYTLLINAGNGPRISDGVDRPTKLAGDVFPYLAAPNLTSFPTDVSEVLPGVPAS
jgi:hypothetical protein